MVNLASPKTFAFIEYVLERKKFTQYRASKDLKGISFGLINKITNWLLEKQFMARTHKEYVLKDPAGIVSAMAIYRDMNSLKVFEAKTSLTKPELFGIISKNGVFCLDTALNQYTNYYKSDRVCAYTSKNKVAEIKKKLLFKPGNNSTVCLYEEKPKAKTKTIKNKKYTDKIRTTIDLACDGKAFAAETLFNQLWGKKIG
ncbi:hypothetical protein HY484_03580 [Candidatus Woesearchaeota archaeon]|nr:hypothetical protein [Candidatus Woesearchaeota archaeon]